ncbi:MAG: hypothetical protein SGARI_001483 [Bacillariaceae sp.]
MTSPNSILIIGATGRTGSHIVKAISEKKSAAWNPKVSAFCRDPSKLDQDTKELCSLTVKGDARKESDLEMALDRTLADLVVVTIGRGDNVGKTDIRTASAIALKNVLGQPQYKNVKVLVISSIGAAGFGIGCMVEFHLRHILKDHTLQEATFQSSKDLSRRTMIIRPTGLTEGESTGKVIMFGKHEKCPTMKTDRKDLAEWAVRQMMYEKSAQFGAEPVIITCVN